MKDYRISLLLDFYGELLTEKQRGAVEMYYNEDLSLAEISEHTGTTRQGVLDAINRAKALLLSFEEKLRLSARFDQAKSAVAEISVLAREIAEENRRIAACARIDEQAREIVRLAEKICL